MHCGYIYARAPDVATQIQNQGKYTNSNTNTNTQIQEIQMEIHRSLIALPLDVAKQIALTPNLQRVLR